MLGDCGGASIHVSADASELCHLQTQAGWQVQWAALETCGESCRGADENERNRSDSNSNSNSNSKVGPELYTKILSLITVGCV